MRIEWIPPAGVECACFFCEEPILRGQKIVTRWEGGLVAHAECAPTDETPPPPAEGQG